MDLNKTNSYSRIVSAEDPSDEKVSSFLFVGFGWNFKSAFVYRFASDELFPDEAYKKAREEFSNYNPRCAAAAFYKSDITLADDLSVFYEFFVPSDERQSR